MNRQKKGNGRKAFKPKNRIQASNAFDLGATYDRNIYFEGILPSITYSISLWGSSNSLQALEEIHIKAARFIFYIKDYL